MRTIEQVSAIKKTISRPFSVEQFLSQTDINCLIDLYTQESNLASPYNGLIKKNTGPTTLNLHQFGDHPIVQKIISSLETYIGRFEITAAFFFHTDYPHVIHNDDTFELPSGVYKGITLPLKLNGFNGQYPKLCFFKQFYFHGPAKFFKGSKNIPTYYNKQIYKYDDIDNLTTEAFVDRWNYFTHLKPQWLEGLSLESALDWVPGNALIFDSVRLHCASDFRSLGIQSKLGISIFTRKLHD
jgi:hypothetical protein